MATIKEPERCQADITTKVTNRRGVAHAESSRTNRVLFHTLIEISYTYRNLRHPSVARSCRMALLLQHNRSHPPQRQMYSSLISRDHENRHLFLNFCVSAVFVSSLLWPFVKRQTILNNNTVKNEPAESRTINW